MSELITAQNLELVIEKNHEIKEEVLAQAIRLQTNPSIMKVASAPQFALLILQGFGLIQMPIEDKYWSGAIFVKDEKIIPVINTALPRANQYFTAWHEIYHLIFDKVSFDHFIETDNTLEERKAEYFAACMLLNGVDRYFTELPQSLFQKYFIVCQHFKHHIKQCWYLYMNMLYKVKMKSFVAKSKKYLTFNLMIYQTDSECLDWTTVWYALLMLSIRLLYKKK